MNILQINTFYRFGSTGRIVADLHCAYLARGHASSVCYGRRPVPAEPYVYRVSGAWERRAHALSTRLVGDDFGHSPIATRRLLRFLDEISPDVVHLHGLSGHYVNAYRLLETLKTRRMPTVLTLHCEQIFTAGCGHALDCQRWESGCHDCRRLPGGLSALWRDNAAFAYSRMARAMADFDTLTVVGVSPWVSARAAKSPILVGRRICTVHNGLDTTVFHPRPDIAAVLRRRLGIGERERVLLHVTPNFSSAIKGGEHILALASRLSDCRFVVVGNTGGATLPERITVIPHTSDCAELAAFYTMADLTLLPSRRETFSMVLAESIACGTPVVGFLAGGPESIAPDGCACFVPQGDLDALERAVRDRLAERGDRATIAARGADVFAVEHMVDGYLTVYEQAMSGMRETEAAYG